MSWYDAVKEIDSYVGEYKKGILGKKYTEKLIVYPSHIEGIGFNINNGQLESESFSILYPKIRDVYQLEVNGELGVVIEYIEDSVVVERPTSKIAFFGINEKTKWIDLLKKTKTEVVEKDRKAELIKQEKKEQEKRLQEEKENKATQFFSDCYSFHIKETTPCYELYREKNKMAVIYIGTDRSLNFLKIDGYDQEESNGIIPFDKIHYYEKAGDIHYVADIQGQYSSFGGSVTGGKFSKLATVGGGLLFGMMGMTAGALLTYKPMNVERTTTSFHLNSETKKIDERSVILNFYSDMKKQYVDIELPNDIYNFLQTYLSEKKYNIVSELEKKTAVHQATAQIENGDLLKIPTEVEEKRISENNTENKMEVFKQKVEKLKMMKEADLLTEEEFIAEKNKLLEML